MAKKVVIETFYWLPHCSTCVKAEQHLLDKGATIQKYVNLKEEQLDEKTLKQLAEGVGGVESLFSKRAMKYRSMGLDKVALSEADMLKHMQAEYTFVKRPVLVTSEGKVLSGFSAKQYDALF